MNDNTEGSAIAEAKTTAAIADKATATPLPDYIGTGALPNLHDPFHLFFDTETTGLPDWHNPSDQPQQPHMVELCAILANRDTVLEELHVLIKPDGWIIPDDVIAIHGITNERAHAEGIPEADATGRFLALANKAAMRVGFNVSFDERIVRIAIMRYFGVDRADGFKVGTTYCVMQSAKPIMKLAATAQMLAKKQRGYKTPNLGEAVQFLTGKPLEGAHTAKGDCYATRAAYYALRDRCGA